MILFMIYYIIGSAALSTSASHQGADNHSMFTYMYILVFLAEFNWKDALNLETRLTQDEIIMRYVLHGAWPILL